MSLSVQQSEIDQAIVFEILLCFPFSSCALSHLRTRSQTWKDLCVTKLASKQAFTIYWYLVCVSLAFSISSSSFRICEFLNCKEEEGVSSINWTRANEGRAKCDGMMASFP